MLQRVTAGTELEPLWWWPHNMWLNTNVCGICKHVLSSYNEYVVFSLCQRRTSVTLVRECLVIFPVGCSQTVGCVFKIALSLGSFCDVILRVVMARYILSYRIEYRDIEVVSWHIFIAIITSQTKSIFPILRTTLSCGKCRRRHRQRSLRAAWREQAKWH